MQYSKEQLWEAYKKLPEQLKEYLVSDKVSDIIEEIFKENGVSEEKKSKIWDLINQVLFRLAPPEDFQDILKKEEIMEEKVANNLSQSVDRYVFFPIKEFLQAKEINKATNPAKESAKTEEIKKNSELITKKAEKTKSNDSYRESVE